MFEIRHLIPKQVLNEISSLDEIEFDEAYNDIEGQIELNFDGNKYGLCHDDVPFGQELLFFWFGLLNSVVTKLKETDYVAMRIPEADASFFEFVRIGELLKISMAKADIKGIQGYLEVNPLRNVMQLEGCTGFISRI